MRAIEHSGRDPIRGRRAGSMGEPGRRGAARAQVQASGETPPRADGARLHTGYVLVLVLGLCEREVLAEILPRIDVALAQHVMPFPAGRLGSRPGPVLSAADSMRITVHGRGAHGSMPQAAVDPVVLAATPTPTTGPSKPAGSPRTSRSTTPPPSPPSCSPAWTPAPRPSSSPHSPGSPANRH